MMIRNNAILMNKSNNDSCTMMILVREVTTAPRPWITVYKNRMPRLRHSVFSGLYGLYASANN
jgi:hypothetical protein